MNRFQPERKRVPICLYLKFRLRPIPENTWSITRGTCTPNYPFRYGHLCIYCRTNGLYNNLTNVIDTHLLLLRVPAAGNLKKKMDREKKNI